MRSRRFESGSVVGLEGGLRSGMVSDIFCFLFYDCYMKGEKITESSFLIHVFAEVCEVLNPHPTQKYRRKPIVKQAVHSFVWF